MQSGTEGVYEPIPSFKELKDTLEENLKELQSQPGVLAMDLVKFCPYFHTTIKKRCGILISETKHIVPNQYQSKQKLGLHTYQNWKENFINAKLDATFLQGEHTV